MPTYFYPPPPKRERNWNLAWKKFLERFASTIQFAFTLLFIGMVLHSCFFAGPGISK